MRLSGAVAAQKAHGFDPVRSSPARVLMALVFVLASAPMWTAPAEAARLALVIGNNQYQYIRSLDTAANDAVAIGKALRAIGQTAEDQAAKFDSVVVEVNQDRSQMLELIRQFKERLTEKDEAVFYFAGHGVQIDGGSYLLPTDIRDGKHIGDDAVPLQRVLNDLAEAEQKFTLIVLDACRTSPFLTRGGVLARGLVPVKGEKGQFVLYSAAAGQSALDKLSVNDPSPNGVFTRVLLEEMSTPGLELRELAKQVKAKVSAMAKAVRERQDPSLYDGMPAGSFFYFRGGDRPGQGRPGVAQPGAETGKSSFPDGDAEAWRVAEQIGTGADRKSVV